jgi:hypothetical protein
MCKGGIFVKKQQFTPFSAANAAAIAMIGTAVIAIVFLVMSLLGLIHPRKTVITLITQNVTYTYDGHEHAGSAPMVFFGNLRPGHHIVLQDLSRADKVGVYENKPQFIIADETGADVTDYYDIRASWGKICVQPRFISLTCTGGNKLYDGDALRSRDLRLVGGSLVSGQSLEVIEYNELIFPGSIPAQPHYRIVTRDGVDVTDQYHVVEAFPHLTVEPYKIFIKTGSAEQLYDGTPLTNNLWEHVKGELLSGHRMEVQLTGSQTEAGTGKNMAEVHFFDQQGRDVSQIYHVDVDAGDLTVHQLPLHIRTGSAEKIYDGEALTCETYKITDGALLQGDQIKIRHLPQLTDVGTIENTMAFTVVDSSGVDVTNRYKIVCDYGSLTLQPLAIRIKTASATKVYDGTVLCDNSYTILRGQLVQGDNLTLKCTELSQIGYTENSVIEYSITRTVNGSVMDVTANYRLSIEYGSLEITAD